MTMLPEPAALAVIRRMAQPAPVVQLCPCFPGTCRGGQVVGGRLANGQRCRNAESQALRAAA